MMVAFQIFGFSVYWYGIFYFISFLIGYGGLAFVGKQGWFRKFPALQQTLSVNLDYLFIFLLLGVLVGGRLGHVFIYDLENFIGNRWAIFAVRKGWMSFIGGGVGVILALLLFRFFFKLSWKEFLLLFDMVLVIVPLGIFFGRLGNYLNQELYGIAVAQLSLSDSMVSTLQALRLVHVYPHVDDVLRVNTNLLSMIFEGICLFIVNGALFLSQLRKKSFKVWIISSCFLVGYSGIRFLFEYLRNDSQAEFIGRFSKSQRVFLVVFVVGVGLWIYSHQRSRENI